MEKVSTQSNEDIIEIDLKELALLLLSKLWILILATVAAGAIGFAVSAFVITPTYESTTSIYISNKNENNSMTYSDTQLASQLTKDYEQLISGRSVLETVIEEQGLELNYKQLKDKVAVTNITNTRIIEITVTDEDPLSAQEIANAIRGVAAVHIKEVTNVEAVNVADEANLPIEPSDPSILKWTVLATAIGCFLSAAIVIIIHLMDDTIKSEDDVMKHLGLSTLAMIPLTEYDEPKTKRKFFGKKNA